MSAAMPRLSFPTCSRRRKKRVSEEEKQPLCSPNDVRWEPSSARFCWAALLPFYFSRPPDYDFQTWPYWAFLHGGAQAAVFSRKKSQQSNCKINKELKKHFLPSAENKARSQTPGLIKKNQFAVCKYFSIMMQFIDVFLSY